MLPDGNGKKVVLAMSGGVDSSVAALLLKQRGYQVVGCFMRLGSDHSTHPTEAPETPETTEAPESPEACDPAKARPGHQGCCSLNDASDARMVAGLLGIPFYVLNFRADFGRIIDYFVAEYNAGRTPNPCVRCNDWLKFGKLAAYARSIDAPFIASGHYARIAVVAGEPQLQRGLDEGKDQSYVLFGTQRHQLEHMLLPIGDLHKSEVRRLAEAHGLPVFDKPDSQEICFVPDNDYARLIARLTPEQVREGDIVDAEGHTLGRHPGQQHFTIGQRRGVGVATGQPLYVLHRDAHDNTVTVGPRDGLLCAGLRATQANWLVHEDQVPRQAPRPCQVKIRYNSPPAPATVHAVEPDGFAVRFAGPLPAVSPGQAAVVYDGARVLGGGWITEALREGDAIAPQG